MLIPTEVHVLMSILDPENASIIYHRCFFSEHVNVLASARGLTSDVLCSNLAFDVKLAYEMAFFRGDEESASIDVNEVPPSARALNCLCAF